MAKEDSKNDGLHPVGQRVQVNVAGGINPEWKDAKVVPTIPMDDSFSARVVEKIFGLQPFSVQVDEDDEVSGGDIFTLYESGSRVRIVSNPETNEAKNVRKNKKKR